MGNNFEPIVGQSMPDIYASGAAMNMTPQERLQVEQMGYAIQAHKNLSRLPVDKARTQFNSLNADAQDQLKFLFKDAAYLKQDPSALGQVANFGKTVIKGLASPLVYTFKAAGAYNRAINMPYLVGREVAQGDDLFSKKTWTRAWDGKEVYDRGALQNVIGQYGQARTYVAEKLLAGRTPGEIIQSYGTLDKDVIMALQEAFTKPEAFKEVLDATKYAQVSPGRDLARMLFDRPPSNGGLMAQNVSGARRKVSGAVDFIYQIAVDPLTWVTGGTSKAVTRAD